MGYLPQCENLRRLLYDGFPIRRWDRWPNDVQTHLFVIPADGSAPPRDLLAGTRLVEAAGFSGATGEGFPRRSSTRLSAHRELMMGGPFWEKPRVWLDQSPSTYAKTFRTPMLLTVSENDHRVPLNNVLEMWSLLQRQRVPSRLLVWPDENHWILKGENSRVFYQEVHAWLAKWLGSR